MHSKPSPWEKCHDSGYITTVINQIEASTWLLYIIGRNLSTFKEDFSRNWNTNENNQDGNWRKNR